MVWSFSKTSELMAGPCSPKHSPKSFTVLKDLFVWMWCSKLKTFKFMAGPRSPTSPVTAQFILLRWKIISFCCCADFQQRSNERMVVLPQTRSSYFHGFKKPFHLDGMKRFKSLRTYGCAVLPQTRPRVPFTVLRNRFVWMLCSQLNTFKLMAGPRFPTISVTAQLILRRWRYISFWCCADFQQLLNERMVVLPQTRSRAFHGVENSFFLDGMKLFKIIRIYGWAVLL